MSLFDLFRRRPATARLTTVSPVQGAFAPESVHATENQKPETRNQNPSPTLPSALARILRPQAADVRWMLPQLAAITPQYIEMTLLGARAGNHVQLYALFDLMLDTWPELAACFQELVYGVLRKKMAFEPHHEECEQPTADALERHKLISAALRSMRPGVGEDENDLHGTIKDILHGWLCGTAVLEVLWDSPGQPGRLNTVPAGALGEVVAPRATAWVRPDDYGLNERGSLSLRITETSSQRPTFTTQLTTTPFPPNQFLVALHKAKSGTLFGGSMLRALAWWWCAANFSADWLLNLAQLFGVPFRWASYDPNSAQETVDRICQMLQGMGSNGWAAFPTGTSMEVVETSKHGGGDSPQGDLMDRADRYARLLILGQTLSGGQDASRGGGKAFGEVESAVKADRIDAAGKYAAGVINGQLIPAILRLNYGETSEAPVLRFLEDEEGSLLEAQRDQILAEAGLRIGVKFLRRKYDIPEPAEGEETIGGPASLQSTKN